MLSGTSINWDETISTMGEDSAFYEHLLSELRTVVAQVLPRKTVEEREEIVQKSAIKLWKMLEKGTKKRSDLTRTYLWRVVYSVFIDDLRLEKRRREESFEPEAHDAPAAEAAGPEAIAVGRELGRRIQAALRQLNEDRRRAVTLRLEGHPVREIAAILGYGYKNTDNLVYRGLEQLRELLGRDGPQDPPR